MIQMFEHDYCFAYFTIEWWEEGYYLLNVFFGNHEPYYARQQEFRNIINARTDGEEMLDYIHARFGRQGFRA